MIFAPPRTRAAAFAAGVAALALALGLALVARGATLKVSFGAFLCYTLGAVLLAGALPLAYWAWATATLRYELRRGALSIHWGLAEHVVPLASVERVVLGRHLAVPSVSGLRLPGAAVGTANVRRVGPTTLYLRYRGPEDVLYLVTNEGAIGLALTDVQQFVRAVQAAQAEAIGRPVLGGLRRGWLVSFSFWADRKALALSGVALLLSWLAAAVVYARYQGRPAALTVHFPSTETAHLASRGVLLHIPESAIAWLALSAVVSLALLSRFRTAAYLVMAGAATAGAFYLIAAVGATG